MLNTFLLLYYHLALMRKLTFGLMLLCICNQHTFAQSRVKFGKVPRKLVEMITYPQDSDALAVVLYDKGEFNRNNFRFSRHLRIKILKNEGKGYANRTFYGMSSNQIRGYTFNLVNGKVKREKLTKDNIYEEDAIRGELKSTKVFMPNVKVGSVVDISYTMDGLPSVWRFQSKIPVAYNELYLPRSAYVDFSVASFGFEPIETLRPGEHWRVTNMPAFKEEPFINNPDNYLTKLEINLRSIRIPGQLVQEFTTSWEEVTVTLLQDDDFNRAFKAGYLNDYAKELNSKDLSREQVIDSCYAYIQQNMKWNDKNSLYTTSSIRSRFLKEHLGNSAEINLLLVSLLQKSGINAYPVALSTRDHGVLSLATPSIRKMNYVIAGVQMGEKELLMDATEPYLSPGALPERCMNNLGRKIKQGESAWVTLSPDYGMKESSFSQIDFTNQTATVQFSSSGYSYNKWLKNHLELSSEELEEQLEKKFNDMPISNYKNKNNTNSRMVIEQFSIDLSKQVERFGKTVILNPLAAVAITENPFKNPNRKYPVDFVYTTEQSHMLTMPIPSGYQVVSAPESTKIAMPDGSAQLTYLCNAKPNMLQMRVVLKIGKPVYTEQEYVTLRRFYDEVVKKMTASVELEQVKPDSGNDE